MQECTSTSETLIDKLEMYKKKQDELIGLLKDIKQIMLEITELDEEDEAHVNFDVNENIGGLKNQPAKNGAQVIENTTQRNFPFSDFFIETTY